MLTTDSPASRSVEGLSGKDKAARVPLDYFRHDGKGRVVAALVTAGAVAAALAASLFSGYWRDLASPGPVHAVHAAWEHDCSVCHLLLHPTSSRNGLQKTLHTGPVADQLCRNCHDGPRHHAREIEGDSGTCASCHAEHRGRHAQLSKPADSSCTRCHSDLQAHVREGSPGHAPKITRFDRDHPQFHLGPAGSRVPLGQARDPGKLKFNHQAHLTAGVRYSVRDAGGWKLGDIKDRDLRERYRQQQPDGKTADQDLVQLNCASCHQLDATDAPKAGPGQNLPLRTRGDYMLPATYEQHCKACHPLTFDPGLPNVEVPHRLQPPAVKRFLGGVFAGQEVKSLNEKLKKGRPMPGPNISREEKEARDRIAARSGAAEKFLFQEDLGRAVPFVFTGKTTCGLCHPYGGKPNEQTPEKIIPPGVPPVWYVHGKFSHRAHRAAKCVACHIGAEKSTKNTDVLLPGIENCQTCHVPLAVVEGKKQGGVRHDCTTCHRYHLGERPEAGLGVNARGVKDRRSLQEFLDGK